MYDLELLVVVVAAVAVEIDDVVVVGSTMD